MLSIVHACALLGLDGYVVDVEVDFNPRAGLPVFNIVGLPDSAVKESRERVRASIRNSSLQFPNKAYTVNLSPADIPKHSTAYDLAIAVGVLASTDQVPLTTLEKAMFVGELSLDGGVRHVKGILPITYTAMQQGFQTIYVAEEDAPQAALVQGIRVIPIKSLGHLVEHLYGLNMIPAYVNSPSLFANKAASTAEMVDFADIKGQQYAKRALEIAAAGNHNVILSGPPGTGKTLLARSLPGIMPPLSFEEALAVTRIYSVADLIKADQPLIQTRPFRAPHHTISQAGLIGGGSVPRPGEVSLSTFGVLFLDEVNELPRTVLEVLRQPIEDKKVTISRANGSLTFPANFLLVMAHNPCPCGFLGDPTRACTCTPAMISKYQSKLSGPLLDRVDLHVEVPRVDYDKLMSDERAETSEQIRLRIEVARQRQMSRFKNNPSLLSNADMGVSDIQEYCVLKAESRQLLELSVRRMQLSARAYHRLLKLSRTIADLSDTDDIGIQHVAEAIQYRPKQQA